MPIYYSNMWLSVLGIWIGLTEELGDLKSTHNLYLLLIWSNVCQCTWQSLNATRPIQEYHRPCWLTAVHTAWCCIVCYNCTGSARERLAGQGASERTFPLREKGPPALLALIFFLRLSWFRLIWHWLWQDDCSDKMVVFILTYGTYCHTRHMFF